MKNTEKYQVERSYDGYCDVQPRPSSPKALFREHCWQAALSCQFLLGWAQPQMLLEMALGGPHAKIIEVQRPSHPASKSRVIPTVELHTGAVVEPVSQPTCPSDPLLAPLPQLLIPQELPNEYLVLSTPLRVCFPETQTAT